jgi:hypothetical protein
MASDDTTDILKAIQDLKEAEPFIPFAILLTSGDRYVIKTGTNLVEMKSQYFYATPKGDDFAFLRKNQIAAIEGPEHKRPKRRKAS